MSSGGSQGKHPCEGEYSVKCKENRMQMEEGVLSLGGGLGTDSPRLGAGTAGGFDNNELLDGRSCCIFIMVFLAPRAGE